MARELARRAGNRESDGRSYIMRVSSPITPYEKLQLAVARLRRVPFVIMPHRCQSAEEWIDRYGWMAHR